MIIRLSVSIFVALFFYSTNSFAFWNTSYDDKYVQKNQGIDCSDEKKPCEVEDEEFKKNNFQDFIFKNVVFKNSFFPQASNFSDSLFEDVVFQNTKFPNNAQMKNVKINRVVFENIRFNRAILTGEASDLTLKNVSFKNSKFSAEMFFGSSLENVTISGKITGDSLKNKMKAEIGKLDKELKEVLAAYQAATGNIPADNQLIMFQNPVTAMMRNNRSTSNKVECKFDQKTILTREFFYKNCTKINEAIAALQKEYLDVSKDYRNVEVRMDTVVEQLETFEKKLREKIDIITSKVSETEMLLKEMGFSRRAASGFKIASPYAAAADKRFKETTIREIKGATYDSLPKKLNSLVPDDEYIDKKIGRLSKIIKCSIPGQKTERECPFWTRTTSAEKLEASVDEELDKKLNAVYTYLGILSAVRTSVADAKSPIIAQVIDLRKRILADIASFDEELSQLAKPFRIKTTTAREFFLEKSYKFGSGFCLIPQSVFVSDEETFQSYIADVLKPGGLDWQRISKDYNLEPNPAALVGIDDNLKDCGKRFDRGGDLDSIKDKLIKFDLEKIRTRVVLKVENKKEEIANIQKDQENCEKEKLAVNRLNKHLAKFDSVFNKNRSYDIFHLNDVSNAIASGVLYNLSGGTRADQNLIIAKEVGWLFKGLEIQEANPSWSTTDILDQLKSNVLWREKIVGRNEQVVRYLLDNRVPVKLTLRRNSLLKNAMENCEGKQASLPPSKRASNVEEYCKKEITSKPLTSERVEKLSFGSDIIGRKCQMTLNWAEPYGLTTR